MEFINRDAELRELDAAAERKSTLRQLESKWSRCTLRARYPRVRFEVLDASILTG